MERTRKPWEIESSTPANAKLPTFSPKKIKNTSRVPLTDHVTENLKAELMKGVLLDEERRNKQRDALNAKLQLWRDIKRPASTPLQEQRTDHARSSRANSSQDVSRPLSEPIRIEEEVVVSKPSTPRAAEQSEEPPPYEQTDWDAFVQRIALQPDSATYEDLLLLAEVNGTAPSTSRSHPLLNVSTSPVEVISRRTTKEGKTKLKLAVAGMRVEKCGICLTQFREGERGAFGDCKHCFHEQCLERWMARSGSCPVCRDNLRSNT